MSTQRSLPVNTQGLVAIYSDLYCLLTLQSTLEVVSGRASVPSCIRTSKTSSPGHSCLYVIKCLEYRLAQSSGFLSKYDAHDAWARQ